MKRYPLIMFISLSLLLTGFAASYVRAQSVVLPEELKGVEVADSFITSGSEYIGEIQTITGHVVVFHEDNNRAYYASNGDALFKQDIVYTLAESRCRIKFTTEDIITMGDNTRIGIDSYLDSPETGEKRSVIRLLKGKAMFYMLKLFKYKIIDTAVNTPTAIIGVRGTQFGTEVRPIADMKAEITPRPIYLADASGGLNWLSQAPAGGPETETIVHCFEGAVEVSSPSDQVSKMLREGQTLEVSSVGVGKVRRTDPEVAGKFRSQTEAPAPESSESEEESSGGQGEGEAEQGESEAEESSEDIGGEEQTAEGVDTSLVQDVTQNQTTKAIEENILDLDRGGYLAAMLTRIDGSEKKFQHLYISDRAQEFETDASLKARDVLDGDSGNPLVLIGGGDVSQESQENTDARLLSVEVDPGTGRETITGPFVVNDVFIGRDDFMDWGYWTVPQIMTSPSGDQYAVDNRGYYVEGDSTHDDEMAALAANNVKGNYTGTAHGTYWTDSGGTDMSGSFKARVDFAKKEIKDFGLSVSGGGHSATITEAGGGFHSNSSEFYIDPNTAGSVWQIDGQDAPSTKKEAYGSVYGKNGQKMGGVWKMDAPNGDGEAHATGLFEGKR